MKRLTNLIGVVFSMVLLTLILGEAILRVWNPTPRRNVFRMGVAGAITMMEGVPTWRDGDPDTPGRAAQLEDTGCDGTNAFRVLVLGDSIFNGISVPVEQVASVRLAAELRQELGPGHVCVKNLSIPGHSLYQTLARGRPAIGSFKPHVVLLELWGGPPRTPVLNGSTVYSIEGPPDEVMATYNPLSLPLTVHNGLMARSRLYEYAVLTMPPTCRDCAFDLAPHEPLLDTFLAQVQNSGAQLITFMPAYLFFPLDAQPPNLEKEDRGYLDWVARHHVQNVPLWEAWNGADVAEIRIDGCHLSGAGHELLLKTYREQITPALEAWKSAQPSPAAPSEPGAP